MLDRSVVLSPATTADLQPFFETQPVYRLQAWVGKVDGRPVGLGGLYFLDDGTRVGFIRLTDEGYKYPKALLKATRQFLAMLRDSGVPRIIAVADPGIEAGERFLRHFGFEPAGDIQGHTIYVWTP